MNLPGRYFVMDDLAGRRILYSGDAVYTRDTYDYIGPRAVARFESCVSDYMVERVARLDHEARFGGPGARIALIELAKIFMGRGR